MSGLSLRTRIDNLIKKLKPKFPFAARKNLVQSTFLTRLCKLDHGDTLHMLASDSLLCGLDLVYH